MHACGITAGYFIHVYINLCVYAYAIMEFDTSRGVIIISNVLHTVLMSVIREESLLSVLRYGI